MAAMAGYQLSIHTTSLRVSCQRIHPMQPARAFCLPRFRPAHPPTLSGRATAHACQSWPERPTADQPLQSRETCPETIHMTSKPGDEEHMAANPHSERPSDEANRKQLAIAQREGAAYQEGLRVMATEIADTGGIQQAGDYIVGFAQERAEGMYHLRGEGRLDWMEPEDENCHLEISVSDTGDGRFIPYLTI